MGKRRQTANVIRTRGIRSAASCTEPLMVLRIAGTGGRLDGYRRASPLPRQLPERSL